MSKNAPQQSGNGHKCDGARSASGGDAIKRKRFNSVKAQYLNLEKLAAAALSAD
jgi:hypothetical protein